MSDKEITTAITGRAISAGLAAGRTFVHWDRLRELDAPISIDTEHVEEEFEQLEDATKTISEDLLALATRVEMEMNSKLAAIFESHEMMLNDQSLKEELRSEIRGKLVSASSAVKAVFLRWEKRFQLMESKMANHKGDDMHDISNRLTNALAGIKINPLEEMPADSVLVARRLLPSDTIFLSHQSCIAVLLEYGGASSHAALFTREMGLPCIAGIPELLNKVPTGAWALIDAHLGEALINPQAQQKAAFKRKVVASRKNSVSALKRAQEQAVTRVGVPISVLANVGRREDTEQAVANGADGVGLYRSEQIYIGRTTPPDVDQLYDQMRSTLEPAKGKPVCVRLLDVGADKSLPFIHFRSEANPTLGRRGIRLLHEYPALLETQLRAILKLCGEFDVSILVPMVVLPEDMAVVKECLTQLGAELGVLPLPQLGAMIETPAAALSAATLQPYADFMSFGTNDLTQYTFAADRENEAVEKYFDDSAAVIFRLIAIVHNDVPRMPLFVCGELAGYTEHIPTLLQCGIKALSVAAPLIPIVKEAIRESSFIEI
ncbi:MAG: phosphoenolpyruvate-protein phosphotransferase [Lentimonas sp.]|jgi:phosphoenolpyruvate-protein phosphotransferase